MSAPHWTEEKRMKATDRSGVIRLSDAQAKIPGPGGERSAPMLHRGTLDLKLNALLPPNKVAAHTQDEIYIVMSGHGVFVHDGKRDRFEPGDFLFVAAGIEHYFEEFNELTLWRIYFGVTGGEIPA
jgi:mannose-6-phosphate isomerase-like protein (cupin superfamily)